MFKSTASNAEVATAPSSYVTTETKAGDDLNTENKADAKVDVVAGQPKMVNGKPVKYNTTHVIPITPKIMTRDAKTGEYKADVSFPTQKPCFPAGDRDCSEKVK
jgi:hypothetical protein